MRIFLNGLSKCTLVVVGLFVGLTSASALEPFVNDFPTEARADYVFGCMAVNGQTREALRRCACSVDKIAEILPYSKYEEAETIMSVVRKGGEKVQIMNSPHFKAKVDELKRAQVEAELLCF